MTVKVAATPLNVTLLASVKWVPVKSTLVPTTPLLGSKVVIVGGGITVKLVALVTFTPPGKVTRIGPELAPPGTVAAIWAEELTVKVAARPLKVTLLAPVKLLPEIITLVPTAPVVGLKLVRVGGAVTAKLVLLVAVATGVVTAIVPVFAVIGTVAVIWVGVLIVKAAAMPLKVTVVVPVKFRPVKMISLPTGPLVGLKLDRVGPTVKLVVVVAVPRGVPTEIGPVVAPKGTMAVIKVPGPLTVKLVAAVLLKVTAAVPVRLVP